MKYCLSPFSMRFVAAVTLFFFAWESSTAHALPLLSIVPDRLGSVQSESLRSSEANPKKTAILLLNAHTSSDAQKNIAELLRYFHLEGIDSFGLEGAGDGIDGLIYRKFSDKKALSEAAWQMVKEGSFTGAEHFYITAEELPNVYGLEEGGLYFQNKEAFLETVRARQALEPVLEKIRADISKAKKKTYRKHLLKFDALVSRHKQGDVALSDFVAGVVSAAGRARIALPRYPNVYQLSEALELERKLSPEELQAKLDEALAGLDSTKLFEELEHLTSAIYKRLSKSDKEKKLIETDRTFQTVARMLSVELTQKEWQKAALSLRDDIPNVVEAISDLPAGRAGIASSAFGSIPRNDDTDLTVLQSAVSDARRFYELAERRNEIFAERIAREMERKDIDTTVVVIGGFHEQGLTSALKEKGIQTAVIAPRIDGNPSDIPYLDRMFGWPTKFQSVLETASRSALETALNIWTAVPKQVRAQRAEELNVRAALARQIEAGNFENGEGAARLVPVEVGGRPHTFFAKQSPDGDLEILRSELRASGVRQKSTPGSQLKSRLRSGWILANHKFMSFHVAALLGVLAHLVALAWEGLVSWGFIGFFFGVELGSAFVFSFVTWHTVVAVHEIGHFIAAGRSKALRERNQVRFNAEYAEAKKSLNDQVRWYAQMFFQIPYGKFWGVVKSDGGFYVPLEIGGDAALAPSAAGPMADKRLSRFTLLPGLGIYTSGLLLLGFAPVFALVPIYLGRLVSALGVVSYLDITRTDDGAYRKYQAWLEAGGRTEKGNVTASTHDYTANRKIILDRMLRDGMYSVRSLDGKTVRRAPFQYSNTVQGGEHVKHQGGNISFQEFMITPIAVDNVEAAEMRNTIQDRAVEIINERKDAKYVGVGIEGGIVGTFERYEEQVLEILVQAIQETGYEPGGVKTNILDSFEEVRSLPKFKDLEAGDDRLRFLSKVAYPDRGQLNPKLNAADESKLISILKELGHRAGVWIALDIAASSLAEAYQNSTGTDAISTYQFYMRPEQQVVSSDDLLRMYQEWVRKFPIFSIEDPFGQDDWPAWSKMVAEVGVDLEDPTNRDGNQILVVGDDNIVTNETIIEKAIERKAITASLIKPNQIGTISETLRAIHASLTRNIPVIISHRSKSGLDYIEAELAVAVGALGQKTGGAKLAERQHKYQRVADYLDFVRRGLTTPKVPGDVTIQLIEAKEGQTAAGPATTRVIIQLSNGVKIESSVPVGTSSGREEAAHLVDGDPHRFKGKGVLNAVRNFNEIIAPLFIGKRIDELGSIVDIDRKLLALEYEAALNKWRDLTREERYLDEDSLLMKGALNPNAPAETKIRFMQRKANLGMNAILPASIALMRVIAAREGLEAEDYLRMVYKEEISQDGNKDHLYSLTDSPWVKRSELRQEAEKLFFFPDDIESVLYTKDLEDHPAIPQAGSKAVHLALFSRFLRDTKKILVSVPKWFYVPTGVTEQIIANETFVANHWDELSRKLAEIAGEGEEYGYFVNPLLVSVRASNPVVRPGRYLTVLNVGINKMNVRRIGEKIGSETLAWRLYAKLIRDFAVSLQRIPHNEFVNEQRLNQLHPLPKAIEQMSEVELLQWRVEAYKKQYRALVGEAFPENLVEQLGVAIRRVAMLRRDGQQGFLGSNAVIIQQMVFGNLRDSYAGTISSRDPRTGEKVFRGAVQGTAQGDEVLDAKGFAAFRNRDRKIYARLQQIAKAAEEFFKRVAMIEFTVEQGKLYLLQVRVANMSHRATVEAAVDMVRGGFLTKDEALEQLRDINLERLKFEPVPSEDLPGDVQLVLQGTQVGVSEYATGVAVFTEEAAIDLRQKGLPVIYLRPVITANHEVAIQNSEGVIASEELGAHAQSISLRAGVPAVIDIKEGLNFNLDSNTATFTDPSGNEYVVEQGKTVLMAGPAGEIFYRHISADKLRREVLERRREHLSDSLVQALRWQIEASGKTPFFVIDRYGTGGAFSKVERAMVGAEEWERVKDIVRLDGTRVLVGVHDVVGSGTKAAPSLKPSESFVEERVIPMSLVDAVVDELLHDVKKEAMGTEGFTYSLWRRYDDLERHVAALEIATSEVFAERFTVDDLNKKFKYTNAEEARARYFKQVAEGARENLIKAVLHGLDRHKMAGFIFRSYVMNYFDLDFAKALFIDVLNYAVEHGYTGDAKGVEWQIARLFSQLIRSNIEFGLEVLADLGAREKDLLLGELYVFYIVKNMHTAASDEDFADKWEIKENLIRARDQGLLVDTGKFSSESLETFIDELPSRFDRSFEYGALDVKFHIVQEEGLPLGLVPHFVENRLKELLQQAGVDLNRLYRERAQFGEFGEGLLLKMDLIAEGDESGGIEFKILDAGKPDPAAPYATGSIAYKSRRSELRPQDLVPVLYEYVYDLVAKRGANRVIQITPELLELAGPIPQIDLDVAVGLFDDQTEYFLIPLSAVPQAAGTAPDGYFAAMKKDVMRGPAFVAERIDSLREELGKGKGARAAGMAAVRKKLKEVQNTITQPSLIRSLPYSRAWGVLSEAKLIADENTLQAASRAITDLMTIMSAVEAAAGRRAELRIKGSDEELRMSKEEKGIGVRDGATERKANGAGDKVASDLGDSSNQETQSSRQLREAPSLPGNRLSQALFDETPSLFFNDPDQGINSHRDDTSENKKRQIKPSWIESQTAQVDGEERQEHVSRILSTSSGKIVLRQLIYGKRLNFAVALGLTKPEAATLIDPEDGAARLFLETVFGLATAGLRVALTVPDRDGQVQAAQALDLYRVRNKIELPAGVLPTVTYVSPDNSQLAAGQIARSLRFYEQNIVADEKQAREIASASPEARVFVNPRQADLLGKLKIAVQAVLLSRDVFRKLEANLYTVADPESFLSGVEAFLAQFNRDIASLRAQAAAA